MIMCLVNSSILVTEQQSADIRSRSTVTDTYITYINSIYSALIKPKSLSAEVKHRRNRRCALGAGRGELEVGSG